MYISLKTTLNDTTADWSVFCFLTHHQQKSISPVHWLGCRKYFQTHHPVWHMAWQPWNGEWGAESHHYGPSIMLSLAWCLLRCHLTSHLLHLSVPRGLLLCIILSKPKSLYRSGVHLCAMYLWRDCSFLFQPVAAVPARDGELINKITWCRVWKEKLQGLGSSRHLFAHTSHDVQNTLTNYTAI